ncbi:hypothetical protein C4D60_Mb06t11210 [Musa balbisiana]|uniref:Uncharacterized protein n=1 Tax=Musa balbisiana TaxID=52838 RepID=A0A4S8IM53_MUSBA|nr:hypothetical protein C4D60_Mb06t11210 [Musa balbisiana]
MSDATTRSDATSLPPASRKQDEDEACRRTYRRGALSWRKRRPLSPAESTSVSTTSIAPRNHPRDSLHSDPGQAATAPRPRHKVVYLNNIL